MEQSNDRKERLEKPIKSTEEVNSDQSAASADEDLTQSTCKSFDEAIFIQKNFAFGV